jgi:hypothetical protein
LELSELENIEEKPIRVLNHKYLGTCGKGLGGKVEERGGVDAVRSSTTNDKEIFRNPFSSFALFHMSL